MEMMYLLITEHCSRSGISVAEYFRTAYVWKFDKIVSISSIQSDVNLFYDEDIVPGYVQDYVCHRLCETPVHTVLGEDDDIAPRDREDSGNS